MKHCVLATTTGQQQHPRLIVHRLVIHVSSDMIQIVSTFFLLTLNIYELAEIIITRVVSFLLDCGSKMQGVYLLIST